MSIQKESARQAILLLQLKSTAELYTAYMPFINRGGLFINTTKKYTLGEEVFLLVELPNEPEKIPIAGQVVWIRPADPQRGKTPGVGIQFPEEFEAVKKKIEHLLGSMLKSYRPTQTM